jgi:hypothetical protein
VDADEAALPESMEAASEAVIHDEAVLPRSPNLEAADEAVLPRSLNLEAADELGLVSKCYNA